MAAPTPSPSSNPNAVAPRSTSPGRRKLSRTALSLSPPRGPPAARFKVLQWNILADGLAQNGDFVKVPPEVLEWDYRFQLVMAEVAESSADIICFQELNHYDQLLKQLRPLGYEGTFLPKNCSPASRYQCPADGLAIFHSTQRFECIGEPLGHIYLDANGHKQSQGFLQVRLRDKYMQRELVIATTHLKSKEGAAEEQTRTRQIRQLLHHLKHDLTGEWPTVATAAPVPAVVGNSAAESVSTAPGGVGLCTLGSCDVDALPAAPSSGGNGTSSRNGSHAGPDEAVGSSRNGSRPVGGGDGSGNGNGSGSHGTEAAAAAGGDVAGANASSSSNSGGGGSGNGSGNGSRNSVLLSAEVRATRNGSGGGGARGEAAMRPNPDGAGPQSPSSSNGNGYGSVPPACPLPATPVIIAGDFNATPESVPCKEMKAHPAGFQSIWDVKPWKQPGGPDASSSSNGSGAGTSTSDQTEVEFSTWKFRSKGESKRIIDHMWFTKGRRLAPISRWRMLTEEEIGPAALPSPAYASDHLALCIEFEWRD